MVTQSMATDVEAANATWRASTRHRQGGGRGPVVRTRPLGVPGYAGASLTPFGRPGETEGGSLRREGSDGFTMHIDWLLTGRGR